MIHRPVVAIEIPSDDDVDGIVDPTSFLNNSRPPASTLAPQILVLDEDEDDDGPLPHPPIPSPNVVLETPLPPASRFEPSILRCSDFAIPSGDEGLICLESDEETEGEFLEKAAEGSSGCAVSKKDDLRDRCFRPVEVETVLNDKGFSWNGEKILQSLDIGPELAREEAEKYSYPSGEDEQAQVHSDAGFCHPVQDQVDVIKRSRPKKINNSNRTDKGEDAMRKRQKKGDKDQTIEDKKRKRQEDMLRKEALKAEAAMAKKMQKEKERWEKGKSALKSIVAEIDNKVVESGTIGGHLLSRLAEKGFTFRITRNPMEKSIQWKMIIPEQISQLSMQTEVRYILFIYEADEFCEMVLNGSLLDHVVNVQKKFPLFTICYLTNKLMSHINRREQQQYKNPSTMANWTRPPIEEVMSKLTTHFTGVHSRHCMDEADLSEHIVGLTSSLASCQFRTKLTWLSINANGSFVPKGFVDRHLIKKNTWLKALTAIPKVQPRFAIAIWKKYPTMRSLLNVYLDPHKTVHEKEFLLKDLPVEGSLGTEDTRLGEVCSKRVYRILMAQNGGNTTDDVENGADFFSARS